MHATPTQTFQFLAATEDTDLGLLQVVGTIADRDQCIRKLAYEHQQTIHFRDPTTDQQVVSFDPRVGRLGKFTFHSPNANVAAPVNMLTHALAQTSLDASLKVIMDAVGIHTGDTAGQFFDRQTIKNWSTYTPRERSNFLAPWFAAELREAAFSFDK